MIHKYVQRFDQLFEAVKHYTEEDIAKFMELVAAGLLEPEFFKKVQKLLQNKQLQRPEILSFL